MRPGDDFYRYVNEGWLKTAAPPPGIAYANAFVDAYLRTQGQLQKLIDGILASTPAPGSDEAKIAALYKSYIDVARRNQLGLSPIKGDLDAVWAIKTHEDAARLQAQPFFKSPIDFGVVPDDKNPQRYVIAAAQGGLGLPSREYYLSAGEPFDGHRAAYLAYIADMFKRAGVSDGDSRAKAILAFETKLAEVQWTPAEQRDPVKSYRLLSIAELQAYAPAFPWQTYLEAAGFSRPTELVLRTDTAIQKSAEVFKATDIETIKSYLAFHLVDDFAPYLTEDLDKASFAFNSTRLHGIPEQEALDKRAQGIVKSSFGEIFGRAYAKAYFPEAYRAKMDQLIANIRAAFHKRLDANPWMDEATRKAAIVKLEAVVKHVGYPDRWRDWSSVAFDPTDLVGNRRKAEAFSRADAIAKLDEKRREWQWGYPTTDINAGYAPEMNSITFPAGILQPPFFDPNADDAVNYGAIGAVIGHELGHGFDDQGSQSDETGALRNWWTEGSRAEFSKRTAVLVQQFNGYSPLPGMKRERRTDAGREHRRSRRHHHRLRSVPDVRRQGARRQGAGDRRLQRRPALLPVLGAAVAGLHDARPGPPEPVVRRAQPERIPCQRRAAQCRRVVRGFRGEGRRQIVPTAGQARPDLVTTVLRVASAGGICMPAVPCLE